MPRSSAENDSGLFAFEEGLLPEIEAFVDALDERSRECDALSAAAAALESPGGRSADRGAALPDAAVDALTSLLSRQDILKRVKEEKNRADRTVAPGGIGFSLVLFDIDGLSAVNDAFGSRAGDKALKRFASILRSTVRSYDAVGRYGSDEFLVLLPGADKEQASRVVREANRKLSTWNAFSKESPRPGSAAPESPLSCSAGIADYRSEGKGAQKSADGIVAQAEYALHRARRKGRGSFMAWGSKGAANG